LSPMKILATIPFLLALLASPAWAQGPSLFYEADGEGPPVVFVPDWAHDASSWFQLLPELRPGWRLVRYDPRGHGRSAAPEDGDYSLRAHVGDLERLLDGLEIERTSLVGSGAGAAIALAYAHAHPEKVTVVVAIAPRVGWTDEERAWWDRFFEAYDRVGRPSLAAYTSVLVDRWFGAEFANRHPWMVAFYDLMLRRQAPAPLVASLERWLVTDFIREPARDVPVLVVWGGRHRSRSGEARVRMAFPRFERAVVRDAGQKPAFHSPREAGGVVRSFLERFR